MIFLLLVRENAKKHQKGVDSVVHCPIYMYCVIMMRINAFLIATTGTCFVHDAFEGLPKKHWNLIYHDIHVISL